MTTASRHLLSLPVSDAIGTRVRYISPKSKRERIGSILSVAGHGAKVLNLSKQVEFTTYREILEIKA
jgi:hypothetical protein